MDRVTAVVLNWNGADETISCVRSLQDSGSVGLEIVVVDNASTDDSLARLRKELPGVPILSRANNGGYAAGNNTGIRYALERGADYVLILNNDVVVTHGFLDPMLVEAHADENVGVVTCNARFQSDHARSYPTGGSISWIRGAGVKLPDRLRERQNLVEFVSGCILLVKREVFERLGLLDESFFMYFEDVEFSRRVGARFRMVYTPAATVYHRSGGGQTWSTQTPTYLYYMARNRFLAFHDSSAAYRAYLVLVSMASAIAKSAAIAAGPPGRRMRLRALWSGFAAGMKGRPARAPVSSSPAGSGAPWVG